MAKFWSRKRKKCPLRNLNGKNINKNSKKDFRLQTQDRIELIFAWKMGIKMKMGIVRVIGVKLSP